MQGCENSGVNCYVITALVSVISALMLGDTARA